MCWLSQKELERPNRPVPFEGSTFFGGFKGKPKGKPVWGEPAQEETLTSNVETLGWTTQGRNKGETV